MSQSLTPLFINQLAHLTTIIHNHEYCPDNKLISSPKLQFPLVCIGPTSMSFLYISAKKPQPSRTQHANGKTHPYRTYQQNRLTLTTFVQVIYTLSYVTLLHKVGGRTIPGIRNPKGIKGWNKKSLIIRHIKLQPKCLFIKGGR